MGKVMFHFTTGDYEHYRVVSNGRFYLGDIFRPNKRGEWVFRPTDSRFNLEEFELKCVFEMVSELNRLTKNE